MTATASAYLAEQRRHLGYHEGPDNSTPFGTELGHPNQPWCGSFQLACARAVGLVLPKFVDPSLVETRLGALHYQAAGAWETKPRVGDHAFYAWDDITIHHVEVVEVVESASSFVTIGGNVDNAVRRVRRSMAHVKGFGRPTYAPEVVPPHHPASSVSLSRVIAAARHDAPAAGQPKEHAADVLPVEHALVAEHLLDGRYVDGSFGTQTVTAYAAWQRRCGYSGHDADGIPGSTSLTRLGHAHGFTVTA